MPELPDIVIYLEALDACIGGEIFEKLQLESPFLLRSIAPGPSELEGKRVVALRRLGKRVVIGLEDELFMVIHLMVAGRFHWKEGTARPKLQKRRGLARFDFSSGSLSLTEAGTKKRASLRLVRSDKELSLLDPGGLEVLEADLEAFAGASFLSSGLLLSSITADFLLEPSISLPYE